MRRVRADTRMIVVEHEYRLILRIGCAGHASIPGTEIAVLDVCWGARRACGSPLTLPGTIVTMGGDDHPFLTERVPSLFPHRHAGVDH